MKIALVWFSKNRLVQLSVRHELYVRGFEALGHDVITVCTAEAADGYGYRVKTVQTTSELVDPDLWHRLNLDVAVMITWHQLDDLLTVIRASEARTIAISDTDGREGIRLHPWAILKQMILTQPRWHLKLRATKFWLERICFHSHREDSKTLASTFHSDVLTFTTLTGKGHFRRFLRHYGRDELSRRLVAIPYPVDESFCERALPPQKSNRIVAIGRWDSIQKNARLLNATLGRYLSQGGRTEFVIVGKDGAPWFSKLANQYPQVRYIGAQPTQKVAELLTESRAILIPSRWETGPIVAWEALAVGCTIIGTPLPNLCDLCADGRFGRVSATHRPRDLARTIAQEMTDWDEGLRDPQAIAQYWRPQVHPTSVCQRMLDALAADASNGSIAISDERLAN